MKIAILGTRGIPNSYGGFEQFAEYLSVGLVTRGHSVTVYNASFHEYEGDAFNGVSIRKIYSPEKIIGASANFIYDFLCMKDALKKDFDIIYELGYHSNAPSYYLLGKKSPIVITNMDGIEWQRSKWSSLTRKLIRKLEGLAVKKSHYLISDNEAIRDYYRKEFGKDSFFIPYGADAIECFNQDLLPPYNILPKNYFLLIARLEPENNIEMILDGFCLSQNFRSFLVIGNSNTTYGKYLQEKYKNHNIRFLGSIYDKNVLDNLRYFSAIYFHGHSVGGTNPSLLEAMASQALIASHDNVFNRSVVGDNSLYFNNKEDIYLLINQLGEDGMYDDKSFIDNNRQNIKMNYSWDGIVYEYETLFKRLLEYP